MISYGIAIDNKELNSPCFYLSTILDFDVPAHREVNSVYSASGWFSEELITNNYLLENLTFKYDVGSLNYPAYSSQDALRVMPIISGLCFFKFGNVTHFPMYYPNLIKENNTMPAICKIYIYDPVSRIKNINGYGIAIYNHTGALVYAKNGDDNHIISDFRVGNVGGNRLYLSQTERQFQRYRTIHASDNYGNLIHATTFTDQSYTIDLRCSPQPISIEMPTLAQEEWVKQQGKYIYYR